MPGHVGRAAEVVVRVAWFLFLLKRTGPLSTHSSYIVKVCLTLRIPLGLRRLDQKKGKERKRTLGFLGSTRCRVSPVSPEVLRTHAAVPTGGIDVAVSLADR